MSDEVKETLIAVRGNLAYARQVLDYGVSELDSTAIGRLQPKELHVVCDHVLGRLKGIISSELAAAVRDLEHVIERLRANPRE